MSSNETLTCILLPFSLIGIWCLVLKINSCFGWNRLAKRHSAFNRPEGTPYHWQSMRLGPLAKYNRCITFHLSKNGLSIAVFPLFAFGHPPLFLQWSQVRFRKEKAGLFGKIYLYDLGTPRGGRMAVGSKMHQAILREREVP